MPFEDVENNSYYKRHGVAIIKASLNIKNE
jgi:hypothetical protein